jgi:hypothetical protein
VVFLEGYSKDDGLFVYSLVVGILFEEDGHLRGGELASYILDRKGMATNLNRFSVNIDIFGFIGRPKDPPLCIIIDLYHLHFELLKSLLEEGLSHFGDGVFLEDDLECLEQFFNLDHVLALQYQLLSYLVIFVILLIVDRIDYFEGERALLDLLGEGGDICEVELEGQLVGCYIVFVEVVYLVLLFLLLRLLLFLG